MATDNAIQFPPMLVVTKTNGVRTVVNLNTVKRYEENGEGTTIIFAEADGKISSELEVLESVAYVAHLIAQYPNYYPFVMSAATGTVVDAADAGTEVYQCLANTDPNKWYLGGTDAAAFTCDPDTGTVTINDIPDFATKAAYAIVVIGVDSNLNAGCKAVAITVTEVEA